jgi:hypothetical protein
LGEAVNGPGSCVELEDGRTHEVNVDESRLGSYMLATGDPAGDLCPG